MAVVMLLLASTVTSSVSVERFLDQTIAGRGALPSLADVQRAAVETLGVTSDSDARSWASRARWKGVVPRVDALVGNTDTIGIRDSWSRVVAHATTEGQRLGVDVRARWELGELVFNDLELRANRETLARAAAIQLARDRATRIYFDRVEVLLQQRQEPTPALALTAARLDGLLRAVTGGKLDRRSSEVSP